MFDATLYINQNMLYLIPVLYFIGMFIRSLQKVPNKFIPFILLALAIIISFAVFCFVNVCHIVEVVTRRQ